MHKCTNEWKGVRISYFTGKEIGLVTLTTVSDRAKTQIFGLKKINTKDNLTKYYSPSSIKETTKSMMLTIIFIYQYKS